MCENGGKVILEIRSSRKIETEIGRDIEIDKERKRKERREGRKGTHIHFKEISREFHNISSHLYLAQT